MIRIILKGRIPSKKNSKVWTWRILISSKEYRKWELDMIKQMQEQSIPKSKLDKELYITYKIWFPDNRKADLSNKVESINDLMVDYWLLADDNHNIIKSMNITSMWVDKENPRAEVSIYLFNNME